jgi:hypothetical protein
MTTCAICHATLTGRQTKYCSQACTNQAENAHRIATGQLRAYRQAHASRIAQAQRARRAPRTCTVCGTQWLTRRADAQYCTTMCACYGKHGHWPHSQARIPRPQPSRPTPAPWVPNVVACAWCGTTFTQRSPHHALCSARCKRKVHRVRRRARVHEAIGTYTWADVIGLFLAFGRCCAYCQQPIEGQPDPDHVIPLSRGGPNGITNVLPACRACNSDKRDLLLDEWKDDRARRGLEPRVTTWQHDDARVQHLTVLAPDSASALRAPTTNDDGDAEGHCHAA